MRMKFSLSSALKLCLFSFITIAYLASCSSTKSVPFTTSTVSPGAEGTVKIKKDQNGNYSIDVNIKDLVDPGKLTPSSDTYVVWIETKESGTKNIGQIQSSSGMFSGRKASITTVSNERPIKVFVTAEDDPKKELPGTQIVLTTETF